MSFFVHDSNTILRDKLITPVKNHQAKVEEMMMQEMKNCVITENDQLNPTSWEQQVGKSLTHQQLEDKLRRVLPLNIKAVDVIPLDKPLSPTHRKFVRELPDGTQENIVVYERGLMPEHSVFNIKTEIVRDPTVKHVDRKDLPKWEIVPGQGVVFDETVVKPGWKKVVRQWSEQKRGWRTVLIRLIQHRLLSLYDAERLFGSDERATWAANTGKQNIELPY